MFRASNSLIAHHDWSLLLAAALVCLGASLVAVHLVRRAQATGGGTRSPWVAAARAPAAVRRLPAHHLVVRASMLIGALLAMVALAVAIRPETTSTTLGAAILLALAIASLLFIAMGAVEITPDPARTLSAHSLSPPWLAAVVICLAAAVLG